MFVKKIEPDLFEILQPFFFSPSQGILMEIFLKMYYQQYNLQG